MGIGADAVEGQRSPPVLGGIHNERGRFMTDTGLTPTEPQRLVALKRANTIRLARAAFKRMIAEGELSAATLILENPEAVRRWTVSELLLSQRRWGSTRCRKFLERNGVSELKTIGALTERQRRLLAAQLGGIVEPAGEPMTQRVAALASAPAEIAAVRAAGLTTQCVDAPELAVA